MRLFEIILVSIGLAMDAFAVSICKGLAMKKIDYHKTIIIGLYFGFFQALMPLIGFLLGFSFEVFIKKVDHWIAFSLLLIIGIGMIKESFEEEGKIDEKVDFKTMLLLSLATSIDALAVGITFAFLNVNIWTSIFTIGIITFTVSIIGVMIGRRVGDKFGNKAEILGGIILIVIGLKILLEHIGVI